MRRTAGPDSRPASVREAALNAAGANDEARRGATNRRQCNINRQRGRARAARLTPGKAKQNNPPLF
jgi:hypothetical protein